MITIKRFQTISEITFNSALSNPFPASWYLDVFVKHFCAIENIFLLGFHSEEKNIGYGAFEKVNGKVIFLGMKPVLNNQEVTDYGDIVLDPAFQNNYKEIWDEIKKWFSQNGIRSMQLDYVREDSQTYGLFKDRATEQATAPYITLPKSWDEYLDSLERKDRKELKRKLKRLETVPYTYRSVDLPAVEAGSPTQNDFEDFIRLHKLSSGEKDEFMSDPMKQFFGDLIVVEKKDWKANLSLLQIEGKNTSAVLSFENDTNIFGYNSGYDPSFNYYSVGLLLHAFKIKSAIEKGTKIYDFLRGTERYKYDLGAKDMKLYKIGIEL